MGGLHEMLHLYGAGWTGRDAGAAAGTALGQQHWQGRAADTLAKAERHLRADIAAALADHTPRRKTGLPDPRDLREGRHGAIEDRLGADLGTVSAERAFV